MNDYNTQQPIDTTEGKAYVAAHCYLNGIQRGATTSGFLEPKHIGAFITALSNVLNDSPDDWADRIVITVS